MRHYTCYCTVQRRVRVRLPHSITSTLSSVYIRLPISTLIGSITAHCSGGKIHYDVCGRLQNFTWNKLGDRILTEKTHTLPSMHVFLKILSPGI